MKLNKINLALAAGFTGAIVSFFMHVLMRLMHWGGMMHMKGAMMHMRKGMYSGCAMYGWGIIIKPIIIFFVAAAAGWLFAFFYNKLEKKA